MKLKMICPKCRDVRDMHDESAVRAGNVKCGECLMATCDVVAFVPAVALYIGHPDLVAYFPYSDESREADADSERYRKMHGGDGW